MKPFQKPKYFGLKSINAAHINNPSLKAGANQNMDRSGLKSINAAHINSPSLKAGANKNPDRSGFSPRIIVLLNLSCKQITNQLIINNRPVIAPYFKGFGLNQQ